MFPELSSDSQPQLMIERREFENFDSIKFQREPKTWMMIVKNQLIE